MECDDFMTDNVCLMNLSLISISTIFITFMSRIISSEYNVGEHRNWGLSLDTGNYLLTIHALRKGGRLSDYYPCTFGFDMYYYSCIERA